MVQAWFGLLNGRYEVVELRLNSAYVDDETGEVVPDPLATTPPFGIVAEDLRQVIPWGGIVGDMRKAFAAAQQKRPERSATREAERWRGGDGGLQQVADVYRDAVRSGDNPIPAVTRRLGFKSESTAKKAVKRARLHGLLGPAVPGKAGEGAA